MHAVRGDDIEGFDLQGPAKGVARKRRQQGERDSAGSNVGGQVGLPGSEIASTLT
jgi:hypothetical protein